MHKSIANWIVQRKYLQVLAHVSLKVMSTPSLPNIPVVVYPPGANKDRDDDMDVASIFTVC